MRSHPFRRRRRRLVIPIATVSSMAAVLLAAAAAPALVLGAASGATVTAAAPKAALHGLVDRQGPPAAATLSYVQAYVVKVNWADLQPTPLGPIVAGNRIDQAIARVRMPDMAGHVALKLRVFAGIGAPEWAKSIGGDPLPYLNNQVSALTGGTIGRFWLPAFGDAYATLQRKLAARYDSVPEIREITVDRCSTLYDELFVRQPGVPANVATLLAAGYTSDLDRTCITQAIKAHNVWKQTISDVDFSPFPIVAPRGTDLAFTLAMMDLCRGSLGQRCGLENNALSTDKLADPRFAVMYARMAQLGRPLTFQTATTSRIGDWTAALRGGLGYGAASIELPSGYDLWSAADLSGLAGDFG